MINQNIKTIFNQIKSRPFARNIIKSDSFRFSKFNFTQSMSFTTSNPLSSIELIKTLRKEMSI